MFDRFLNTPKGFMALHLKTCNIRKFKVLPQQFQDGQGNHVTL